MTPELEATLKNLPDRPGVYLMKDARGTVIYVGKAQSLRNRVRSYWQKESPVDVHRIKSVIERVVDVEYTMTDSISEALLLESNLIKRFQPAFNIRLKDDKTFPWVKLSVAESVPRLSITRKVVEDGSRYFGPYTDVGALRSTLRVLRRVFPLRTCANFEQYKKADRPCLNYHIRRCVGPCYSRAGVTPESYARLVEGITLFLSGKHDAVRAWVTEEMRRAAEAREYERAGR